MEKSLALVAQHAAFKEGIMKVWQPKGVGNDPPSLTIKEVNIHLIGSKEVLVLPVYTNTKVFEIKALLIERLSANPDHLRLVQKQGSSFRVQQDHEEVARTVTLHGIKSFKRVEAADKTGDAKSFCHDDGVISRNFQLRVFHLRPAWGTQSVGQNPCGFPIPTSVGQFSDTFWGIRQKNWTQTHNFSVFLTKSTTATPTTEFWRFFLPKTGNPKSSRQHRNRLHPWPPEGSLWASAYDHWCWSHWIEIGNDLDHGWL